MFFAFAPILLLITHAYILAYTHKFWALLARMRVGGYQGNLPDQETNWAQNVDLEHILYPWLMIDFGRLHHTELKKRKLAITSLYGSVAQIVNWALVPFSIALISLKAASFSNQNPEWSGWLIIHILTLSLAIILSVYSLSRSREILGARDPDELSKMECGPVLTRRDISTAALTVLIVAGCLGLYAINPRNSLAAVGAAPDLVRAELSSKPAGWPAQLQPLDYSITPEKVVETVRLEDELRVKVQAGRFNQWKLNGARMFNTFAVGADFGSVELNRASLVGTQLQFASFTGADIRDARLQTRSDPERDDGSDGDG